MTHVAVCIASGPSLTQEDVNFCRGKARVYAVKECYHMAPWADVLYAADTDWWERLHGVPDFAGERWTVSWEAAEKYPDLHHIPYKSDLTWSSTMAMLATGGNSGFQALNLAVLQGASKVFLLGYDMGHGPKKHWWSGGPLKRDVRPSDYGDWIKRFAAAATLIPVPVINCSRKTAITCFPKSTIQESL